MIDLYALWSIPLPYRSDDVVVLLLVLLCCVVLCCVVLCCVVLCFVNNFQVKKVTPQNS